MRLMNQSKQGRAGALGTVALLATLMAGCEVTNPGPIQDAFLAESAAQPGLIFGAQRSIATTFGARVLDLGLMGRELFPGGQTGAWGTGVEMHAGHVQEESGPGFTNLHQARFITETAITRFTAVGASPLRMYEAWLWNGIAHRILGEWWCDTVLPARDPSDTTPSAYTPNTTVPYFQRAVESFTNALGFAANDAQRNAAYAGRAQANLWLGNWAAALSDAANVNNPNFEFRLLQGDAETALYNYMAEGNSGIFRSYTTRFTWFEQYYNDTGDPRVVNQFDSAYPVAVGSLSGYGGNVVYRPQRKYRTRTDPFNLASYWEMQLIRAEAILRGAGGGDFNDAVALINSVRTRTGVGMAPVTAANAQEAWQHLMRERRIELWLTAKSAPDERRWSTNLPYAGANVQAMLPIPNWEDPALGGRPNGPYTPHFANFPRGLRGEGATKLCFDIPATERDRNPNITVG
jgi:hypothetical protein